MAMHFDGRGNWVMVTGNTVMRSTGETTNFIGQVDITPVVSREGIDVVAVPRGGMVSRYDSYSSARSKFERGW